MGLTEGARRATGVSPGNGCLTPLSVLAYLPAAGRRENLEECHMENSQEKMVRKRRYLTAKEKYQIFLEATMAKAKDNGSISEVLRRWGIHSSDLTRIRAAVEQGAVNVFKERKSRKPKLNIEQYEQLKAEKKRLEATIIEQAAELALLKKKDRSG